MPQPFSKRILPSCATRTARPVSLVSTNPASKAAAFSDAVSADTDNVTSAINALTKQTCRFNCKVNITWQVKGKQNSSPETTTVPRNLRARQRRDNDFRQKPEVIYCAFTALLRKSLIINGAGEGNRPLVSALGRPHATIEPHPLLAANKGVTH